MNSGGSTGQFRRTPSRAGRPGNGAASGASVPREWIPAGRPVSSDGRPAELGVLGAAPQAAPQCRV